MAATRSFAADELVRRLRAAGCVFAEQEAALLLAGAADPVQLEAMVAQRIAGLPIEHVLGWAEFAGLRLRVEPGVFVPRHRTELLAQQAVALVREAVRSIGGEGSRSAARPVVLDLCCGVGALGAAVATELAAATETVRARQIELYAADVDPVAVRCARRNLEPFGAHVVQGDLFEPLPTDLRGRVDVLVANVPYVPTEQIALMPPEARLHESRVALDGGDDGLEVVRRVADQAPAWLAPGGRLLVETSRRQAPAALDAFARSGLVTHQVTDEDPDEDVTVVIGTVVIGTVVVAPS